MKISLLAEQPAELEPFFACGIGDEIQWPHPWLAREGNSIHEIPKIASIPLIILADRLLAERHLNDVESILSQFPDHILKVRDFGLAHWLSEKKRNFILTLENGCANEQAVSEWVKRFSPFIIRASLNVEMPFEFMQKASKYVQTEVLAFGPPNVLYSGRHLMPSAESDKEYSTKKIRSDEASDLPFTMIQSHAGTSLLNGREICLFEHWDEMEAAGINWVRIDIRRRSSEELNILANVIKNRRFLDFRKLWPHPITHGFFQRNRTDAKFSLLPRINKRIRKNILATILDIDQSSRTALIRCEQNFELPMQAFFFNRQQQKMTLEIKTMTDTNGQNFCRAQYHNLMIIPIACKGFQRDLQIECDFTYKKTTNTPSIP